MNYTISYKVDLRVDVQIEAESLEEAMKKAQDAYIDGIEDLNCSDVVDIEPVNISDENGNLLADF